jgi:voltage-gated potassium channel
MNMTQRNLDAKTSKASICSTTLLFLAITIIFVVSIFPQSMHRIFYNILFTLLIVFAALSMDRGRGIILKFAVGAIAFEYVADFLNLPVLAALSRIVAFLFFITIVIGLITQIAKTKRVTARVITESISGYLLLGIVFSLIVTVASILNPESFNFPVMDPQHGRIVFYQGDFIYYAFVTYTTLGYGDLLPITPQAKSLAILAAVCGQIYLTVIIAMLVGKFLSHSQDES